MPVADVSIGRPRKFCRRSCRQRAYEARRRGAELGLGDEDLIVTRNELFDVRDRLVEITDAMREANDSLDDGVRADRVLQRLLDQLERTVGQNGPI